jgi:hypothetical protein
MVVTVGLALAVVEGAAAYLAATAVMEAMGLFSLCAGNAGSISSCAGEYGAVVYWARF